MFVIIFNFGTNPVSVITYAITAKTLIPQQSFRLLFQLLTQNISCYCKTGKEAQRPLKRFLYCGKYKETTISRLQCVHKNKSMYNCNCET